MNIKTTIATVSLLSVMAFGASDAEPAACGHRKHQWNRGCTNGLPCSAFTESG